MYLVQNIAAINGEVEKLPLQSEKLMNYQKLKEISIQVDLVDPRPQPNVH